MEVSSLGVWEEGAIIDVGSTASPLEAFLFLEDDSPVHEAMAFGLMTLING